MLQRTAQANDSALSSLYAADGAPSPTPGALGVYAIDEQALFRRGVAALLGADKAYHWVGEAGSAAEALRVAHMVRPDLVLLDLDLPELDGVATMQALQPYWPGARYVLMAGRSDPAALRRAAETGASCLLKSVSPPDLMAALCAAGGGERVLSPAVRAAVEADTPAPALRADLTPREHALLRLMAQGLDNRSIAVLMDISVPTVKFHVTNVMTKLRAANRTAAVLAALRENLVSLDDGAAARGDG
jgi:NarL family two-component system response regulator LiaR